MTRRRLIPRRVTPSLQLRDGDYIAGSWDGTDASFGWVLPRGLHWFGRLTRRWWQR